MFALHHARVQSFVGAVPRVTRAFQVSWAALFAISVLMALVSIWVISAPIDQDVFHASTGQSWSAFASASPTVAVFLEREVRLLGVSHAGVSMLAAAVTWLWLRTGDRRATGALWILPATLAATAALLFSGGTASLGQFYALLAVLTSVALVVADRALAGRTDRGRRG